MLILSRKPGDAVLIDGGIRIVVLGGDHRGVRLGIEAPASVAIVREEIANKIADENRRAGATSEDRKWLETLDDAPEERPPGPEEDNPKSLASGRTACGSLETSKASSASACIRYAVSIA